MEPEQSNTNSPKSWSIADTIKFWEQRGAKKGNRKGAILMPLSKKQADAMKKGTANKKAEG